ncbi:MAG TPA: hypothetical protein VEB43_10215 [Anaeromyxobacter sp.]|nr:hypothetical protein [Anaeromyxobacter sp.]
MIRRLCAGLCVWAVVLVAPAKAAPPAVSPLADAQRRGVGSLHVVATLAHEELAFPSDPSLERARGIPGGGWYVVATVERHRFEASQREVLPLRDALLSHDVRTRMQQVLAEELKRGGGVLENATLALAGGALDRDGARALLDAAERDAVLLLTFGYELSADFRHIHVTATAALAPSTRAAGRVDVKKLPSARWRDFAFPGANLYTRRFVSTMPAPGWGRWKPELAPAAITAIDGGIAEIARMLVWDLVEGAAPEGGGEGEWVELREYGDDDDWERLREVNGRLWYRSDDGALGSNGATYPPLPAGAAAPTRNLRFVGLVQAAAYAPSSSARAAGAIAAMEILSPARQAIEAAKRDAEGKQRSFGSTPTVPQDPTFGVTLDRLAQGRTIFAPDVEVYTRTALAAELRAIGLALAAEGRPKLRGEILDATVERSSQGFAATLRLRWALTDPAGTALWTAEKTATTLAEERADNEVAAFHVVLRKSAEALALDPAFAAAVK